MTDTANFSRPKSAEPSLDRVSRQSRPWSSRERLSETSTGSSTYSLYGARGSGKFSSARPKSDVDWAILRAKDIPGPGTYRPESSTVYRVNGGRFSTSKPKSDVDWLQYHARQCPGPGEYNIPSQPPTRTPKFSLAKPKSEIEFLERKAMSEPGPGQYADIDKSHKINGGRFSTARPKSDVDVAICVARQLPGPGAYDVDKHVKLAGGKFNLSKPKTDVDWEIYRASKTPGPSDYEPDSHYRINGGKFSSARPKSALDQIQYVAKQTPGPGEYSRDLGSIAMRTGAVSLRPSTPSIQKNIKSSSTDSIPRRKSVQSMPSYAPRHLQSFSESEILPARAASAPPRTSLHRERLEFANETPVVTTGMQQNNSRCIRPASSQPRPGPGTDAVYPGRAISAIIRSSSIRSKPSFPQCASNPDNSASHRNRDSEPPQKIDDNPAMQRNVRQISCTLPAQHLDQVRPPSKAATRNENVWATKSIVGEKFEIGQAATGYENTGNIKPFVGGRSSSIENYAPKICAAPVDSSKRIPKQKKRRRKPPASKPFAPPPLSEKAKLLLDLALQSPDFRNMLGLYSGVSDVKDPGNFISNYANMWSFPKPLY